MRRSNVGYVKVHRKIRDHEYFREPRVFSRFEAWMDFILEANHEDDELKRGSFETSVQDLAKRWRWSPNKVRRFLRKCEGRNECGTKVERGMILVCLKNYKSFQDVKRGGGTKTERSVEQVCHEGGTNCGSSPYSTINKEIKNKEVQQQLFDVPIPKNLNSTEFLSAWERWLNFCKKKRRPLDAESATEQLAILAEWGKETAIAAIGHSIRGQYRTIYQAPANRNHQPRKNQAQENQDFLDRELEKYANGKDHQSPHPSAFETTFRELPTDEN